MRGLIADPTAVGHPTTVVLVPRGDDLEGALGEEPVVTVEDDDDVLGVGVAAADGPDDVLHREEAAAVAGHDDAVVAAARLQGALVRAVAVAVHRDEGLPVGVPLHAHRLVARADEGLAQAAVDDDGQQDDTSPHEETAATADT
jgi:hypothetical protein